ncbi:TetR/AcrR family transcriptional regulator [Streptomyces sp. NPDC001978]|uniref:TetR/AcrR family transcriptional regulator n=1 Tax=Streptomyces sp. NPDC001978 TaxID=3364627 RepID=UPI0036768DA9
MASATLTERRRTVRTGGRSARVRAAVYEATLLELRQRGYATLSIEDIAVRAGVHKTTIYRRWGTKDTLLAAAMRDLVDARVPVPDTGAIETDLRAYARSIVDVLTSAAGAIVVAVLFSDAARAPEVAEVKRNHFAERQRLAAPIVERAIQRGELPADTDPHELIGLMAAPIYYRLLVTGEPIDHAVGDRAALAALAAAPAVRPGR